MKVDDIYYKMINIMDRQYAYNKEDEGYAKFEHFNRHFLHLQELKRMVKDHPSCDASGTTTDGTEINFELKVRNLSFTDSNLNTVSGLSKNGHSYKVNTLYIEGHKVGDIFLDYFAYNREPVYVNFLNDGYVVVYNLRKLKTRPNRVQKKIWSKLYQNWENQIREELPINEGFIYKWNGNNYILISRPKRK